MKRLLLISIFIIIAMAVHTETSTFYHYVSDNYRVNSDSSEEAAREVSKKMEAALKLFNSTMHFDLSDLKVKLKVTIFAEKDSFDDYLSKIINQSREDFVYIHYSDITKSELVGFAKDDTDAFDSSLVHQGFIQFFKAFIPNPPIWIREGLATYLDNSVYNKTAGIFTYKSNMIWLDSLKSLISVDTSVSAATDSAIPLTEFLTMDRDSVQDKLEQFYPQAWGIVTFLLNSNIKSYNRIFWDSLSILDPDLTLAANSAKIITDILDWADYDQLTLDFVSYISSLKTFNDLVAEGIDLYTSTGFDSAEQNFLQAVMLEPESYIPQYYLGLIAYAKKDYVKAAKYYGKALGLGADSALTKYALGVNAFADNQFDTAISYLTEAKKTNPDKRKLLRIRAAALRSLFDGHKGLIFSRSCF
jgi:tetratricopeptide (TPR) repeat protein